MIRSGRENTLKRIIASVCIIVTVSVICLSTFAFASETNNIVGNNYEEAIKVVTSLGLMKNYEGESFKADNTISRAEFITIIANVLKLNDIGEIESVQTYSDVSKENKSYNDINVISKMGIISGYQDGTFRPDEPLLYEHAVKIFLKILGYDVYLENLASYQNGYMTLSVYNDISKNIVIPAGEQVTRGMVAQILNNSFDIPIMEQKTFSNKAVYSTDGSKTFLSEYLKLDKYKGKVIATHDTHLTSDVDLNLSENEIDIDGDIYRIENQNANEFLGQTVLIYAKEDSIDDRKDILYISPKSGMNKLLTVNYKNIDISTTKESFAYYDDQDKSSVMHKITIENNASVIVNGKYIGKTNTTLVNREDLIPTIGEVKLLDNDNDGIYEVVFVNSYNNRIVGYIDTVNEAIYDKVTKAWYSFKTDTTLKTVSFETEGKTIALSDVSEWDVLSIYESRDHSIIKAKVSSQKVNANVTEVNDETVVINDKKYNISGLYKQDLEDGRSTAIKITPDIKGDFYLDALGEIAAVKASTYGNENYGYLINASEPKGMDGSIQIEFLTADGDIKVYKTGSRLSLGVEENKSGAEAFAFLKSNGVVSNQLLIYKLNNADEITALKTAGNSTTGNDGNVIYDNNNVFTKYFDGTAYHESKIIARKYFIDPDTKIFTVPSSDKQKDKEAYELIKKTLDTEVYSFKIYDVDEKMKIKALVVINDDTTLYSSNPRYMDNVVVDKCTYGLDDEENPKYKLSFYSKGKLLPSIFAQDDTIISQVSDSSNRWGYNNILLKDLKQGDIIQYYTNAKGNISGIRVFFRASDASKPIGTYGTKSSASSALTDTSQHPDTVASYGVVKETYNNYIQVNTTAQYATSNNNRLFDIAKASIYIVDSNKTNIEVGSISDIQKDDKVFVICSYTSVKDVVIYR